jgi:oxygen-independent coproporphyrinogen-3 oxidase
MQKPYLGLGPSAHSYDGTTRQWNVSNIKLYNESVMNGTIPCKQETLTTRDHFNEFLITRLRTQWGVDLNEMEKQFGENYKNYFLKTSRYFLDNHYLQQDGNQITLSRQGKFISDAIFREMILIED